MSLIVCPDCSKQISDKVEQCPFCGCPAEHFRQAVTSNNQNIVKPQQENMITFSFANCTLSYPSSLKIFAELYGKYYQLAQTLRHKYFFLYESAADIHEVVTSLTDQITNDIKLCVEEAAKDLYSLGIIITADDFSDKYVRSFKKELSTLSVYKEYQVMLEEKRDLMNQREMEKAGRGQWVGGGFGLKGAIKGAITAGVLNMATDMFHSIGDNIAASKDNRYINNKLAKIHNSNSNQSEFALSVYYCCFSIIRGIKAELSKHELIDLNIFPNPNDVYAIYDTTTKYEKDHEKLFCNMIKCLQFEPEKTKYYEHILCDLFEKDCDLEEFFKFWNLGDFYKIIEASYREEVIGKIDNPFIENESHDVIQLLGSPLKRSDGILVEGKVIKGKPHSGTNIVFVEGFATPKTKSKIVSIYDKNSTSIDNAKIGKTYSFLINLDDVGIFKTSQLIVDSESFSRPEANLYASYESDGEKKIWGFAEQAAEYKDCISTFVKTDNYVSNVGVNFNSSLDEIKKIYGDSIERFFYAKNDAVYVFGKNHNWKNTEELEYAEKFLVYNFGEQYAVRFYFNKDKKLILIAYLKNVETVENTKLLENFPRTTADHDVVTKIILERWDEQKDFDSKNKDLILSWTKAWQGNQEAQIAIGHSYFSGKGARQDYDMALKWYKKAAEQGNPEGITIVENWDEYKNLESKSLIEFWVKAKQGDPTAKIIYEHRDEYKKLEPTNQKLIEFWVKAWSGDVNAQFAMGNFYHFGENVAKDNSLALKWYKKAAEQGNNESQIIAEHWSEYKNLDVNNKDLISTWIKAWGGDAKAEFSMGKYYDGKDVALRWYQMAADHGSPEAQAILSKSRTKSLIICVVVNFLIPIFLFMLMSSTFSEVLPFFELACWFSAIAFFYLSGFFKKNNNKKKYYIFLATCLAFIIRLITMPTLAQAFSVLFLIVNLIAVRLSKSKLKL